MKSKIEQLQYKIAKKEALQILLSDDRYNQVVTQLSNNKYIQLVNQHKDQFKTLRAHIELMLKCINIKAIDPLEKDENFIENTIFGYLHALFKFETEKEIKNEILQLLELLKPHKEVKTVYTGF